MSISLNMRKFLNYMVYYNYFIQAYIDNKFILKILIDKINLFPNKLIKISRIINAKFLI